MSSNRLVSMRALLCAAALTAGVPALLSGSSAQGQSSGAPLSLKVSTQASPAPQAHPAAVASAEEEATALKNDASHQGIKVHGHWKIVVKNTDGSVVQTREFENSLTANGANSLAQFLSGAIGYSTSGGLLIDLLSSGTSICGKPNCGIVPSTTAGVGYNFCIYNQDYCSSTALTTTVNGGSVLLAGQITATQAGTITTVSTQIGVCDRGISPYTCTTTGANTSSGGTFTSTIITPVSVSSGQIVQVSVMISFS